MEKIIEIKELEKSYTNVKAINNLSLDVYKGEILGLLGPNGSGKSTTISCLLALLSFQKGSIKILGQEMTPESYDIKAKIGVIFQDVAVINELSVYENIDYFCGLYIKDKTLRKQYVNEAIELVSLEDFKKFRPEQLSGGLLRRLNIACGIAHKPSIIILDEPTVAVDPQSRNNILEGIRKLNDAGATIIYTTHYMEEVEILCDRIVIIDKGEIVAQGNKDDLKSMIKAKEKVTVEFSEIIPDINETLSNLKHVINVDTKDKTVSITYEGGKNNISDLVTKLNKLDLSYVRLYSELPTLNDVFLELTGKELRD